MRLAKDYGEDFAFQLNQEGFEGLCPNAAAKYDKWTNSKKGVQQTPGNLDLLGEYLNTTVGASIPSQGPA